MHLQHDARIVGRIVHGALVVGETRAVGGAHFDQAGAGLAEHIWNAEPAADLHELTAAHDNARPGGVRGECEHHGRSTVVHYEGRLGTAEAGEKIGGEVSARSAGSRFEIEFEVGIAHRCRGSDGGHRRPPEVRSRL